MCVRTKTSYGCGHYYKTTNECDSTVCNDLARFHYMKEGDCQDCKGGGDTLTRGRDGMGRYARRLKRSQPREALPSPDEDMPTTTADMSPMPNGVVVTAASPWYPSYSNEKIWETPTRRQADEAWLSEHDDRLSDLQERLENLSVSHHHEPESPSRKYEYKPEEFDYYEHELEQEDERIQYYTPTKPRIQHRRPIEIEISRRSRTDSTPSHQQRERQYSHDSLPDSMPSYRSSPRAKAYGRQYYASPRISQEYDYYTSSQSSPTKYSTKRHTSRAKTEPHVYARSKYGHEDRQSPIIIDRHYDGSGSKYSNNPAYQYNYAEPRDQSYVHYRPRY